jgi:hypothetical protein
MRLSHNYTSHSMTSLTYQSLFCKAASILTMETSVWLTNQSFFWGGRRFLQFGNLRKLFRIESPEVKKKCRENA